MCHNKVLIKFKSKKKMSNCDGSSQTENRLIVIKSDFDNVGIQDLFEFEHFTSQAVVANIIKRFLADICYTSIGGGGCTSLMLLYINPNKPLAIYNKDFKQAYSNSNNSGIFTPPPHIYGMLNEIMLRGLNGLQPRQSIILTGESGSGKSLNFVKILDYIQHTSNNNYVSKHIYHFNIFIDFFYSSNCNSYKRDFLSTRCMKLIELEFDFLGKVVAGQFFNYHLEKWRVLGNGSRNFHIFYVLISGCESSLLKSLGLVRNGGSYKILQSSSSQSTSIANNKPNTANNNSITDSQYETDFNFVKTTLQNLLRSELINYMDVLKLLSSILKLGNVCFVPSTNLDGTEGVDVNFHSNNSFQFATSISNLLGIDECVLETLIVSSQENSLIANRMLSNLLQTLYTRLIIWLTQKLKQTTDKKTHFKLSLLDNSGLMLSKKDCNYEDFVVNYINEKVQINLIDLKLRWAQEFYISQGAEWILIDTVESNSNCVDFIEKTFINFTSYEDILKSESNLLIKEKDFNFKISHYNNTPNYIKNYNYNDFSLKNLTLDIPQNLQVLLSHSKNNLISELFKTTSKKKQLNSLTQSVINVCNCIKKLELTIPHYIRCIKPNELNDVNCKFESSYLKFQINYHRVIDYCKLVKFGFSYYFSFREFIHRYKLLSLKTWPICKIGEHSVKIIMEDLGFIFAKDFFLSFNKFDNTNNQAGIVFLKGLILTDLESYRTERREDLCILIQKTYRAYRVRKGYKNVLSAQLTISRSWKNYLKLKKINQVTRLRAQRRAVTAIQNYYILWKRRMYLKELLLNIRSVKLCMLSPVSKEWPVVPSYLQESNCLLKSIFHRWRCRVYRSKVSSGNDRARLNEKATASLIFKNHKLSYTRSVSHPFLGDYIRLRQNSQWRRTALHMTSLNVCNNLAANNSTSNNEDNQSEFNYQTFNIVFADLINKVTRSSGKFLPIVLVVTTSELLILDPRTLNAKYKLSLTDLIGISMSTLNDDICILHLKESSTSVTNSTCGLACNSSSSNNKQINNSSCMLFEKIENNTKGDLVLHTCHLVEMVTKIYLVYKNHMRKNEGGGLLPILFSDEFPATFGLQNVTVSFKSEVEIDSSSDHQLFNVIPPSQMRITRKKYSKMEFLLL